MVTSGERGEGTGRTSPVRDEIKFGEAKVINTQGEALIYACAVGSRTLGGELKL